MTIPEGFTQEEVLSTIENVAKGLAYKYKFGYYEAEDIKQEIRLFCWEALDKYKPEKGQLSTFLWTHCKNRLFNLKRNKYERPDCPCYTCPLYDKHRANSSNQCLQFSDKRDCEPFSQWNNRNSAKKNIMSPIGIGGVRDENEKNMSMEKDMDFNIDYKDMVDKIDKAMPVKLRSLWIRMKNDVKLNKAEREKVLAVIRDIIGEQYDT